MRRGLVLFLSLVACAGHPADPDPTADTTTSGTESSPEPTPVTPPPPQATLRLIHAAVESRDQAILVVADGDDSTGTAPAGYEFASTDLALPPGEHALSARADGAELIGASFALPEGHATIIAYSTADFPVALALALDTSTAPASDAAQIRMFHALVGQGSVDFCSPPSTPRGDGSPIVTDVALGSFGGEGAYTPVPAGVELVLRLRAHHAVPCHGRALGIAHGFTPVAGANYTLILVGRAGRRGVAPELLFCADPPAVDTSCATVAIAAH